MPGIAVKSTDSAGGAHRAGGQSKFKVEGQPVVLLGDQVEPHGPPPHGPFPPVMVEGSSKFRIGGIPVVREGHAASCGHGSTGRPKFRIP